MEDQAIDDVTMGAAGDAAKSTEVAAASSPVMIESDSDLDNMILEEGHPVADSAAQSFVISDSDDDVSYLCVHIYLFVTREHHNYIFVIHVCVYINSLCIHTFMCIYK